jgi:hypothetical protein
MLALRSHPAVMAQLLEFSLARHHEGGYLAMGRYYTTKEAARAAAEEIIVNASRRA